MPLCECECVTADQRYWAPGDATLSVFISDKMFNLFLLTLQSVKKKFAKTEHADESVLSINLTICKLHLCFNSIDLNVNWQGPFCLTLGLGALFKRTHISVWSGSDTPVMEAQSELRCCWGSSWFPPEQQLPVALTKPRGDLRGFVRSQFEG